MEFLYVLLVLYVIFQWVQNSQYNFIGYYPRFQVHTCRPYSWR